MHIVLNRKQHIDYFLLLNNLHKTSVFWMAGLFFKNLAEGLFDYRFCTLSYLDIQFISP